jgi:hypothetical protein
MIQAMFVRGQRVVLHATFLLAALLCAPFVARAQAVIEPRGIQLSSSSLVVGRDGPVRIAVTLSRPITLADTVPMRVLLASLTNTDTVVVWTGRTGQSPVWDGTIGNALVADGRYDLVVEVQSAGKLHRIRRGVAIVVEPMPGVNGTPLPEFTVTEVQDTERQGTRLRSAWTRIAIGAVLGVSGAALVQPAIDNTAPHSPVRWGVAAAYGGGVLIAADGLFVLWRAVTRPSLVTVNLPIEANMASNRAIEVMSKWRRVSFRFLEEEAR